MKQTFFLFLFLGLICNTAFAQKEAGCTLPLNEKYSFKDFTGKSLNSVPVEELNGTCVKGSCFYQEILEKEPVEFKEVFPKDMKNVEFVRCNLSNVLVSSENTFGPDNQHELIAVQNDLQDWIMESSSKEAVEPIRKEEFIEKKLNIDPAKIPAKKIEVGQVVNDKGEILDKNREVVKNAEVINSAEIINP